MLDVNSLNPEQRSAVTHRGGPLLVLAGAGTGKTRVIAYRVASLLHEGVHPEHILALTFTQKAAGEMRERVAALVGKKLARKVSMGTFHAFGARLLRADIHRLGITNAFTILDEGDQRAQIRRLLRAAKFDEKRCPVPDVVAAISLLKNTGTLSNTMMATEAGQATLIIRDEYDRHLRMLGALDFDDLILMPTRLFTEVPDVAARIQRRFHHVLVDEFQDTSHAQMEFLLGVTHRSETVCAVGDDDQAIYGWRGAVVDHILRFETYFPGAFVVALTENYRCTPQILSSANKVIANNLGRRPKTLRTSSPPAQPVKIIVCNDEDHEVRAVVMRIAEGIKAGDKSERYAILFRTGTQTRPFETSLRLEGIPYVLVGGPELADRKEVKDVLAYAAMMAGRDDEAAFRRVMTAPARGVGPTSMDKLLDHARNQGTPILAAAAGAAQVTGLQKKAAAVFTDVGQKLMRYRDQQQSAALTDDPTERLQQMLEELGYMAHLEEDGDLARAARRRQTVEIVLNALMRLATRLQESAEVASETVARVALDEGNALDQLMDRLALDREDGDRRDDGVDERPGVRLMTLHAAKGLEFPVVFLPGWEDGVMPHRRALEDAARVPVASETPPAEGEEVPRAAAGTGGVRADIAGVEEERRLAYVGITRARELLFITRAVARRKYGKVTPRVPSRFLAELPEGDVEVEDQSDAALTPEQQRQNAADMFRKLRDQMG